MLDPGHRNSFFAVLCAVRNSSFLCVLEGRRAGCSWDISLKLLGSGVQEVGIGGWLPVVASRHRWGECWVGYNALVVG